MRLRARKGLECVALKFFGGKGAMRDGASIPMAGDFVEVRTRRWLVESVTGGDALVRVLEATSGKKIVFAWTLTP